MGRRCLPDHRALWAASLRRNQEDWQTLLDSLGLLYTGGVAIDWRGFDSNYHRRKLTLPTYPFQRQRYWTSAKKSQRGTALPLVDTAHPLLGQQVRSPAVHGKLFANRINIDDLPWLADHSVSGMDVFPATAYIEMAMAAAKQTSANGNFGIEQIDLLEAMILPENVGRDVQCHIEPASAGVSPFKVYSLLAGQDGDDWTLHVTGALRARSTNSETLSLDLMETRERLDQIEDVHAYYGEIAAAGLEYGPAFQSIRTIWRADGEALGHLELTDAAGDATAYHFHPALMDGALQLAAAAIPEKQRRDLHSRVYMPVSVAGVRTLDDIKDEVWAHVRLQESHASPDLLRADIGFYDGGGKLVAEISGLRVMAVSPERLRSMLVDTHLDEWFYEIIWRQQPHETPAQASLPAGLWLIFADRQGVAQALAESLRHAGHECVLVWPGEAYGRKDDHVWRIHPERLHDYRRLLDDMSQIFVSEQRYVVHLWSLDGDQEQPSSRKQSLAISSALYLTQALAQEDMRTQTRLWLATRGGQPVVPDQPPLDLSQTGLWGLGGVIALEFPGLHCTRIDLDPIETATDLLLADLLEPDSENQIAYRQGERLVPRLTRKVAASTESEQEQPVRLEISRKGLLDHLVLRPAARRTPGPGEVEIRVHAAGLNFRDVMNALGLYPGEAGPLGGECAGEIVAVGEGVANLQIGDAVMGIAPASFGTYTSTLAELVVKIPDNLSYDEAATMPIAFLTAHYALNRLGGMKSGDRVLIHAASGGVGQAAVQLAQRVGAEIFATAGSPEKQQFLAELGIEHIMHSRTLDFAEQITEITGGLGVDLLLNSLSGDFIPRGLDIMAPGGRFLEIDKVGIWTPDQVAQARPDIDYFTIAIDHLSAEEPDLIQEMLAELAAEFASGKLQPLPMRIYSLGDAVSAFRLMAQTRHIGKIVISQEEAAPLEAPPELHIRKDATYLITGGFGGLGSEVARWLVDQGAQNLLLVGRSAPNEAGQALIAELSEAGANIQARQADVGDDAQVRQLLGALAADSSLPPVAGVIHAAGVLDDGVLTQQTWERFERVMRPKTEAARLLHEHTKHLPLDFFVMFSSLASVLGSPGQGNYAAANAYLDGLAYARQRQNLPALTINWGPWAKVGMTAASARRDPTQRTAGGLQMITPDLGIQALERLMQQTSPQVVVMPVDWPSFLRPFGEGNEPALLSDLAAAVEPTIADDSAASELLQDLQNAAPDERHELLVSFLSERLVAILGLTTVDRIDTHKALSEMGMDSLMAVELKNTLDAAVKRNLPATIAFEYPTIDAMATYLSTDVLTFETEVHLPVAEPPAEEREDTALDATLSRLEGLSDEEAEALLLEELLALEEDM
jgi:NADPH:quinone reductase-like Zn-dependent oxidoreductase/acyl carrier protein